MEKTIHKSGGVSCVDIHGDTVIKKYPLEDQNINFTHLTYSTAEICFLSMLKDQPMFPKVKKISYSKKKPEIKIYMDYLGEPISSTYDYLDIFYKIVQQVDILHQKHIVHSDLKFDNILIDSNDNIHIIDFSHSKLSDKNGYIPFCNDILQTYYIMSPETVDTDEHEYLCSFKIDIWSLGCILYQLIANESLFHGTKPNIISQHKSRIDERLIDEYIPDKLCCDLLHYMLLRDPTQRPNTKMILNCVSAKITNKNLEKCVFSIEPLRCIQYHSKFEQYVDQIEIIIDKQMNNEYRRKFSRKISELLFCALTSDDDTLDICDYTITIKTYVNRMKELYTMDNISECFSEWYINS